MLCNRPQNTPHTHCITTPNPYTPNKPNQDAHASLHGTNIWAGTVADGAGSKPLSHHGSHLATTTALNYIATQQPHPNTNLTQLLQNTITHTRNTLLNTPNPHQLGTTLAIAIATPTQWAAAVIGDAFIIIDTNNTLQTITTPTTHEHANITELITSKTINPTITTSNTPATTIALSTDGLTQTTLTKNGNPSPKFWPPLFQKAHQGTLNLPALIQHMTKNALLTDDTTLLIHTPKYPPTKEGPLRSANTAEQKGPNFYPNATTLPATSGSPYQHLTH